MNRSPLSPAPRSRPVSVRRPARKAPRSARLASAALALLASLRPARKAAPEAGSRTLGDAGAETLLRYAAKPLPKNREVPGSDPVGFLLLSAAGLFAGLFAVALFSGRGFFVPGLSEEAAVFGILSAVAFGFGGLSVALLVSLFRSR